MSTMFQKFLGCPVAFLLKIGNCFYKHKNFFLAILIYKIILLLDSHHFAARANLATAYFEKGNLSTSIPYFLSVLGDDYNNAWWHNYLSQAYQKNGHYDKALNEAWQAVDLSGGAQAHQLNLAYTIYEVSDEKGLDFIKQVLTKWYRKYPQSGIAQQCYRSFFYDKKFTRSNQDYVESLFDVFAPDFETVLNDLNYQSPQDIANILFEYCSSHKRLSDLKVLDLGCGSGLCGKYLAKKFSSCEIVGVDISSAMLSVAASKKIYKELIKDDIEHYLLHEKRKFDIVVAADVLTYFGTLDSLFAGIEKVLDDKGVFAFSFSKNEFNAKEFFLTPSSRFVHSFHYVQNMLSKHGLKLLLSNPKTLRKEGDKDVIGYIVAAIKS